MKMDAKKLLRRYEAGERDFHAAKLHWAKLHGADLSEADLTGADLGRADLTGADLSGADFDLSAWPLSCGTLNLGATDGRLVAQLVRHTREVARANDSEYGQAVFEALASLDRFHTFRSDVEPMEK